MIQWSDRGPRPMSGVLRTYSRILDMNHDRREKLFFFVPHLFFLPQYFVFDLLPQLLRIAKLEIFCKIKFSVLRYSRVESSEESKSKKLAVNHHGYKNSSSSVKGVIVETNTPCVSQSSFEPPKPSTKLPMIEGLYGTKAIDF